MAIIVSSILLLVLFVIFALFERKYARRYDEFLRKNSEELDDLATRATEKYRSKYGKDPTGSVSTYAHQNGKKNTPKPV